MGPNCAFKKEKGLLLCQQQGTGTAWFVHLHRWLLIAGQQPAQELRAQKEGATAQGPLPKLGHTAVAVGGLPTDMLLPVLGSVQAQATWHLSPHIHTISPETAMRHRKTKPRCST